MTKETGFLRIPPAMPMAAKRVLNVFCHIALEIEDQIEGTPEVQFHLLMQVSLHLYPQMSDSSRRKTLQTCWDFLSVARKQAAILNSHVGALNG